MSGLMTKNVVAKASLGGPISADEAQSQVDKLKATLPEIEQAKKWIEEYGDMNDRAEVEILEAKIRSSLALLENYLATGEWEAPAGAGAEGAGDPAANPAVNDMFTLTPGWNGNVILRDDTPPGYEDIENLVRDGEFEGTVYIDDDGNPASEVKVAFQASATTKEIRAFNHGNDIIYVETYLDENGAEKKRFWVGVGHVTNTRAKITIDAHNLEAPVNIDLSRTLRISDGSGLDPKNTVGGFLIFGSDRDDTLTGSQGEDTIVGMKGDDKIYGMGGTDILYGDDDYFNIPEKGLTAELARQALGLQTDLVDGDDTLDGGEGNDILQGGGGINYGYETDKATKTKVQHSLESSGEILDRGVWLGGDTNDFDVESEGPGFAVLAPRRGTYGIVDLNIPPGYSMAYAEADGTSLKITFVKEGREGQPPRTFVVTIKGALDDRRDSLSSPMTLVINGNGETNIIDLHNIDLKNNNFRIRGMEEEDLLLEPKGSLAEDGLTAEEIQKTSISSGEVNNKKDLIIPNAGDEESQSWIHAEVNANKEIEVTLDGEPPAGKTKTLHIDPKDFEKVYVFPDPKNYAHLLVVLVRTGADGKKETLVVRVVNYYRNFDNSGGVFNWLKIERSVGAPNPGEAPIPPTPVIVLPLRIVPKELPPNYFRDRDVG